MVSKRLFNHFYPHTYKSGTPKFFLWINEYIRKDYVILDLGAGPSTSDEIKKFKGKVKKVIGADIDPIVLDNSDLDKAYLIKNDKLPFDDNSFDLIFSDYVLEHVEQPIEFLEEVKRVLKPGKSFFFRTPNNFHYVTVFALMTPHWLHLKVANKVRGLTKETHDPYRTLYRMNSKRTLQMLAKKVDFHEFELNLIEAEPYYLKFNSLLFLLGVAYERLVNKFSFLSFMRVNIFGRFEK